MTQEKGQAQLMLEANKNEIVALKKENDSILKAPWFWIAVGAGTVWVLKH